MDYNCKYKEIQWHYWCNNLSVISWSPNTRKENRLSRWPFGCQ